MPDSGDDIEARLDVLEREVARLREQTVLANSEATAARADAAAARVLAGGADRDVSEVRAEMRAHIQALNALRETQLEQGREMVEMRKDIDETRAEMREGFAEMREGFAKQATGMAQITALLTMIARSRGSQLRRAGGNVDPNGLGGALTIFDASVHGRYFAPRRGQQHQPCSSARQGS